MSVNKKSLRTVINKSSLKTTRVCDKSGVGPAKVIVKSGVRPANAGTKNVPTRFTKTVETTNRSVPKTVNGE